MRVTIHADGSTDSPSEVQLIREALTEDGTARRFFLCLGCKDIIETANGEDHVHECDGSDMLGKNAHIGAL